MLLVVIIILAVSIHKFPAYPAGAAALPGTARYGSSRHGERAGELPVVPRRAGWLLAPGAAVGYQTLQSHDAQNRLPGRLLYWHPVAPRAIFRRPLPPTRRRSAGCR